MKTKRTEGRCYRCRRAAHLSIEAGWLHSDDRTPVEGCEGCTLCFMVTCECTDEDRANAAAEQYAPAGAHEPGHLRPFRVRMTGETGEAPYADRELWAVPAIGDHINGADGTLQVYERYWNFDPALPFDVALILDTPESQAQQIRVWQGGTIKRARNG